MQSFYGGPPGQSFKIHYPLFSNFVALQNDLKEGKNSSINIGEYVMVSYGKPGTEIYYNNLTIDLNDLSLEENKRKNWHSSLWQKFYDKNEIDSNDIKDLQTHFCYKFITQIIGDIPEFEIQKQKDPLNADESPKVWITKDPNNLNKVILNFAFPQLPKPKVKSEIKDPKVMPSIDKDDTDVNSPIFTFNLPRAPHFNCGEALGDKNNYLNAYFENFNTDYGIGDYYINEKKGCVYEVINNTLATSRIYSFKYIGQIQTLNPEVKITPINTYNENGEVNKIESDTEDRGSWIFKVPKIPNIDAEINSIESNQKATVTSNKKESAITFHFNLPKGVDGQNGKDGESLKIINNFIISSSVADTLENGVNYIKQFITQNPNQNEMIGVTWLNESGRYANSYWYYCYNNDTWGRVLLTGGGGNIQPKVSKIEVTTPPQKTTYNSGEIFDPTGMVVTATYSIGDSTVNTANITNSCTFSPSPLIDGTTTISISFVDSEGTTFTTSYPITVKTILTSITVISPFNKMDYEYGDTLVTTGLRIRASYSDGSTQIVGNWTCTPTILNSVGGQVIKISYTEDGITKETGITVNVTRKKIYLVPTWIGSLTYTGSPQFSGQPQYWNDYDPNKLTIGGNIDGTNAGTYTARFTPTDNYCWEDGSITFKEANWIIKKAPGSLILNTNYAVIDSTNYATGVIINASGDFDGLIQIQQTTRPNGINIEINDKQITISGDGSTSVSSASINFYVISENYTNASAIVNVSTNYLRWSWGSEDALAAPDSSWWYELQNWIKNQATEDDLQACVGKRKCIEINTDLQVRKYVRCIGYNVDRDQEHPEENTLTFQLDNAVNGNYSISIPPQACRVSKGTVLENQGPVSYASYTSFDISIDEIGLGNSGSTQEFCEQNTLKIPYQHFTDNQSRIKFNINKSAEDLSPNPEGVDWTLRTRSWVNEMGDSRFGYCSIAANGTSGNIVYIQTHLFPAFAI